MSRGYAATHYEDMPKLMLHFPDPRTMPIDAHRL